MTTHDDDGAVIGDVVLCWESGGYGVDVSGGVWCMGVGLVLGTLGTVLFGTFFLFVLIGPFDYRT